MLCRFVVTAFRSQPRRDPNMVKRRRDNANVGAAGTTPHATQSENAKVAKTRKQQVVGDGKMRCGWAGEFTGSGSQLYINYHDTEWGRPCYDDAKLFEMLTLEGAQAGLSWATVLKKRESYRAAFRGFDPATVAGFTDEDVERLMLPEAGIIKHRGKILSTISNAKCVLEAQEEFGSLSNMLWGYVPDKKPIVNKWRAMSEVPSSTGEAEAMSRGLKKRGFKFVGPTICYAFMQAVGMVNDHVADCFCYDLMNAEESSQHHKSGAKAQPQDDALTSSEVHDLLLRLASHMVSNNLPLSHDLVKQLISTFNEESSSGGD